MEIHFLSAAQAIGRQRGGFGSSNKQVQIPLSMPKDIFLEQLVRLLIEQAKTTPSNQEEETAVSENLVVEKKEGTC